MEKASHPENKLKLLVGTRKARAIAYGALRVFEKNLSNADPASFPKAEAAFRAYLNTRMLSGRQADRIKMLHAHHLKMQDVCQICLANERVSKLKVITKVHALRQLHIAAPGLPEADYEKALAAYPDTWLDCPEAWRWSSPYSTLHPTLSIFKSLREQSFLKRIKGNHDRGAHP
ncbi:hypothetical protein M1373_01610 [Candidatus Marsarchaeota archaeon]|nr:hypothetical protein [Candidatus Marsarchaeota archaeon]